MGRRLLGWSCALLLVAMLAVPAAGAAPETPDSAAEVAQRSGASTRLGRREAAPPAEDVLVRFAPGVSERAASRTVANAGGRITAARPSLGVRQVTPPDGDVDALVEALVDDPAVELVQPNHRRRAFAEPNDPRYATTQRPYAELLRLPEAWAISKGSSARTIAVLDTGVDAGHPDLKGRVLPGKSYVDDSAGWVDDVGHGTHVAGIAAASTGNGIGISGAAWNARILPVKVLDEEGFGEDADIAAGIVWAADQGVDVINLSFGCSEPSDVLDEAVEYAVGRGVVIVAAAGNDGDDLPQHPAAHPDVLAVGAVDHTGRLSFSSWGEWVDVVAPGWHIDGPVPVWPGDPAGGAYETMHGTSAAAPLVSGVAVLLRAAAPGLSAAQVAERIRSTARDAGARGADPHYGFGVVDAAAALGAQRAPALPLAPADIGDTDDHLAAARPLPATGATISPEGDVDHWRYEHDRAAGGALKVTVTPPKVLDRWGMPTRPTMLDPVVRVWSPGPEPRLLAEVDDQWDDQPEVVEVPAGRSGAYVIEVANYYGAAHPYPYRVDVEVLPAAPAPFFPGVDSGEVEGIPRSVVLGDFDGDGSVEAVVSTTGGEGHNRLQVYRHRAFGPEELASVPSGTTPDAGMAQDARHAGLAADDLDGDGLAEVLHATQDGFDIYSLADGTPTKVGGVHGPELTMARHLAVGDVDGDGNRDVAVLRKTGLVVARGGDDGAYTVEPIAAMAFPHNDTWEVQVVDLDDDEVDEVVVSRRYEVQVWRRDADGWQAETLTARESAQPDIPGWLLTLRSVDTGDVTGDGRPDLVVLGQGSSMGLHLNVFAQRADGSFEPSPVQNLRAGTEGRTVRIGDVDGDGDDDVVVVGGSRVVVRLQDEGQVGDWTRTSSFPGSRVAEPKSATLGDFDADGRLDVLVAKDSRSGLVALHGYDEARLPQPWVTSVSPAARTAGVERDGVIRVRLGRPLDPASVSGSSVQLLDGRRQVVTARLTTSADGTVVVTPVHPLAAGGGYQLRVDGLRDTAGEILFWPQRSWFHTIDPPPAVGGLTSAPRLDGTSLRPRLHLGWAAGTGRHTRTVARFAQGRTAPAGPTVGSALYAGTATSVTSSELLQGRDYTVALWASDGRVVPTYSSPVRRTFDGTALTVTSGASRLQAGTATTLTVTLRRTTAGTAIANQTLALHRRAVGTTSWRKVADLRTNANGVATASVTPTGHTEYQVRYAGQGTVLGSVSSSRRVDVTATVTASLDRTSMILGRTAALSGKVSPAHAGHRVELQQRVSGTWRTITSTRLSSTSTYRFPLKPTRRGTYEYRVRFPGDADHGAGVSPMRTLKVS